MVDKHSSVWILALAITAGACAEPEIDRSTAELREVRLDALAARLAGADATFADRVPPDLQTQIYPSHTADASRAAAVIDATGDRVFFPMPRERRIFATVDEIGALVADHFGSEGKATDEEGTPTVWGSYVQHGPTFFEDFELGVRYRVTDPIAAFLGGVDGQIQIGDEIVCIERDACEGPRAAYLVPDGELTAPAQRDLCGSNPLNVCVRFHAFFNKAPFPPWARHGSNANMYTHTAIPSTELTTGGFTFELRLDPNNPFGNIDNLPVASVIGEEFVESANWCFGGCPAFGANGVCGVGEVIDPDVAGVTGTGNGPHGAQCWSSPPTPW